MAAPAIGAVISAAGFGLLGGFLSGAAASSAGLAALGGGAVVAGGFGVAGGTAIVATVSAVATSSALAAASKVASAAGIDSYNKIRKMQHTAVSSDDLILETEGDKWQP